MDTYTLLRAFADSWMLLAMTLFFIGMVLYTLRPGSRQVHADIAAIPLRNDALPEVDVPSEAWAEAPAKTACNGRCETCRLKSLQFLDPDEEAKR
ncbi:MAG: cbb3-type cytochrome c oxidase subunit 3 [Pseudomonadota bacterium]